MLDSQTRQDTRPADAQDGPERRERRSRDRYGRDRRERGDRPVQEDGAGVEAAALAPAAENATEQAERPRYPTGFVNEDAEPAVTPASAPARTVAASAAPATGLPKVQSFELPVKELVQVAESSGLQWVNSDAQKIAAVQAAIAAEPQPVRVPRERPPAVVIDAGPLVLVETKRDLREMKLPFEQTSLPLQE
jgi:ribonuclease E